MFELAVLILPAAFTGCREHPSAIHIGPSRGSLESTTTLIAALSLMNEGNTAVVNVRVTSIALPGAMLAGQPLPMSLGDIAAGATRSIFVTFSGTFAPGSKYTITVGGSYLGSGSSHSFEAQSALQLPSASPGSAASSSSSSPPHKVSGAPYPHQAPNFPPETNKSAGSPVPRGTHGSPEARSAGTGVQPVKIAPPTPLKLRPAPRMNPKMASGVAFFANSPLGISGGTINEPSGAVGGGIIFESANSYGREERPTGDNASSVGAEQLSNSPI
jgi:hypothetical protein